MTNTRPTHHDTFNGYIQKRINAAVRSVLYKTNATIQDLKDELKSRDLMIEDCKRSIECERELRELRERELRKQCELHEERERELRERENRELKNREIRERELRELKKRELRERQLRERELRECELRERELKKREARERELRERELRERELRERELRERELRERELRERELRELRKRDPPEIEQRHQTPISKGPPPKNNFPKALKEWCDRVFEECPTEENKSKMECLLRVIITEAITSGTVNTKNWSSQPIPRLDSAKPSPLTTDPFQSSNKNTLLPNNRKK